MCESFRIHLVFHFGVLNTLPEEKNVQMHATHLSFLLVSAHGILFGPPYSWEKEPAFFRFGAYVKKERFEITGFNPKTQRQVLAKRARPAARSFEFSADSANGYLLTRFWPGPGPGPGVEGEST